MASARRSPGGSGWAEPFGRARAGRWKSTRHSASGLHRAGQEAIEPGREQAAGERPGAPWPSSAVVLPTIRAGSRPNPPASARANWTRSITSGPATWIRPEWPASTSADDRPGDVGAVARARDLVGRAVQRLARPRGPWPADRRSSSPAARGRRPRRSGRSAGESPSVLGQGPLGVELGLGRRPRGGWSALSSA